MKLIKRVSILSLLFVFFTVGSGSILASEVTGGINEQEVIVAKKNITATAGEFGSITPSGAVSVTSGANQAFTITANQGYHIADVLVDAVSAGALASYEFTNVIADHTISASFAMDTEKTITTGGEETTTVGDTMVIIQAGTIVTGPVDWDGIIHAPVITTTYTEPNPDSGFDSATPVITLDVGAGDTPLTFDKAVKIIFTGQAGKYVGWSRGGVFTKITATCDSATNPTLAAGADCKIDVAGDLIVWTKHFTVYITYTQTPTPTPAAPAPAPASSGGGGGGGGGSSITYCSSVTYKDWGLCVNGFQQRAMLSGTPANCSMTTEQQLAQTRACVAGQVLGEKIALNELTAKVVNSGDEQLNQILADAAVIWSENIDTILNNAGGTKDTGKEKSTADKYIKNLIKALKNLTGQDNNRLNYFITYGTKSAKILGEGERSGALNSYKSAFGKLPASEADWQDLLKIANGRWTSASSTVAEANAKIIFKKIYGREADLTNAKDLMAIKIIAYGLRPAKRNLNSEKAAIKSFKFYFKKNPTTAIDWDAVRAIAYSGATR